MHSIIPRHDGKLSGRCIIGLKLLWEVLNMNTASFPSQINITLIHIHHHYFNPTTIYPTQFNLNCIKYDNLLHPSRHHRGRSPFGLRCTYRFFRTTPQNPHSKQFQSKHHPQQLHLRLQRQYHHRRNDQPHRLHHFHARSACQF